MALATQCPHCYTSFRVANDQLKLHAGMVRCGACKQTFNGIEHLLEPGEPPRTPPAHDTENKTNSETMEALPSISEIKPSAQNTSDENHAPQNQETVDVDTEVRASSAESQDQTDLTTDSPTDTASTEARAESAPINTVANEAFDEAQPSQQELDDIALFQAKLASFTPQLDIPSSQAEVDTIDDNHLITEHASAQLKIIQAEETDIAANVSDDEPPSESPVGEDEQPIQNQIRRPAPLTASLDFELSDEERSWSDNAHVSQLEVKTQAAIIDGDDSKYSKNEPVFSDDMVLEDDLEQDLHQLLAEVKTPEYVPPAITPRKGEPSISTEPIESTKDAEPEFVNDNDDEQPDFMLQAEKARRYSKLQYASFWLGVVILFLSASAQGIYFFRSGIAAHFPQTKPLLLQMCQKLSCQLKLPTQIDAIVFDSTELLTLNQDPHILSLALQLQNKSNMTQAWPMLELTLKDSRGKTVLQRVFTPEEYLETKALVSKGFTANSDSNIKVHFELSTMKAANYAVGVFYP